MPKSAAFFDRRSGAHDNGRSSSCVINYFFANKEALNDERAYRRIRILYISFVSMSEQGGSLVTKLYPSSIGHTPYA